MRVLWFRGGVVRVVRRRRSRRRTAAHTAHYEAHKEVARAKIHERLTLWSAHVNIAHGRVAIRNQVSRWGSCSSKGNLNFNYRVAFLPESLMDYVIVHELCHLLEMNHSQSFWAHVEAVLPDYRERRALLMQVPLHTPPQVLSPMVEC